MSESGSSLTILDVLRAWALAPQHVRTTAGVSAEEVRRVQEALGLTLPEELVELYRSTDGMQLEGGDLELYPWAASEEGFGLEDASALHRQWEWGLPDELLVIGSDGSDGLFGVWAAPGARHAIVVHAFISLEEPAMAVVGTSLASFLAAWTAYYLPLVGGESAQVAACLDALGVPEGLREGESDVDDEHVSALLAWASPDLPDEDPQPYERPVSSAELTRLATV